MITGENKVKDQINKHNSAEVPHIIKHPITNVNQSHKIFVMEICNLVWVLFLIEI